MSIKGKQQKPNQNAFICQPNKPFSACNQTTTSHLSYIFPLFSPQAKGRGEILFWCGTRRRWRPDCSLSALHLLNQLVEFDQTCTDTLLGGRKEVIRFWWHWPHFKVIPALWNIQILTKELICTLSLEANDGFWPKFIYFVTLVWIKDLIAFSRSPHYKNCKIFKFWPNKACLHPISWTKWRILAKLHIL